MTGLATGVKGWEAQLSSFYELLLVESRDATEIEPCGYPVCETKPKQRGPSIQQCCSFECLALTVKAIPYYVFSKRFVFLKDASPEAETPGFFLKVSFKTKKKFEYTNLEGF